MTDFLFRTRIMKRRCRVRWRVRAHPIERFRTYTKVQNTVPPLNMRDECHAANVILSYRKFIKNGSEEFLKAWWKVRGYQL